MGVDDFFNPHGGSTTDSFSHSQPTIVELSAQMAPPLQMQTFTPNPIQNQNPLLTTPTPTPTPKMTPTPTPMMTPTPNLSLIQTPIPISTPTPALTQAQIPIKIPTQLKLEAKVFQFLFVKYEDQLADILTKAIFSKAFHNSLDQLGIGDIYAPT
ncbi:hypothetical protein L3X38_001804 [Prunus dulcis]|uniref:Uncharacterized protein n=1 Tax=Prunus dulcis TaxID=3755 RepID=A0AAD4WV90_PRUDU|nr:hypothetical protein L3X38_001804 [Prunus dulcis]